MPNATDISQTKTSLPEKFAVNFTGFDLDSKQQPLTYRFEGEVKTACYIKNPSEDNDWFDDIVSLDFKKNKDSYTLAMEFDSEVSGLWYNGKLVVSQDILKNTWSFEALVPTAGCSDNMRPWLMCTPKKTFAILESALMCFAESPNATESNKSQVTAIIEWLSQNNLTLVEKNDSKFCDEPEEIDPIYFID